MLTMHDYNLHYPSRCKDNSFVRAPKKIAIHQQQLAVKLLLLVPFTIFPFLNLDSRTFREDPETIAHPVMDLQRR